MASGHNKQYIYVSHYPPRRRASCIHAFSSRGRTIAKPSAARCFGINNCFLAVLGELSVLIAVGQVQLNVYGEALSALHFAWKVGKYYPTAIWEHICPLVDWAAVHWREPDSGIWEVRGGLRHFILLLHHYILSTTRIFK